MDTPVGFYAYVFRDPRDGVPFYVGKGRGTRCLVHLRQRGPNRILSNKIVQIRRAGFEPTLEVIAARDEAEAFAFEKALIWAFGRRDQARGPLLNYTAGGEGSSGREYRHSDETRAKIAAAIRGKKRSAETRERMRQSANHRLETDEGKATLAKAIAAASTTPVSDDRRRLLSEAAKRLAATGHQARMTELAAAATRGVPKSGETRAKMSAAGLKRWRTL